jgi:membrane protein YdbS with pleckstrin-like domain
MGSIFVLAFLVILLPGVAVYAVLDWAGLPIGGASLLGLLVVFVSLGSYPVVLRRLGWAGTGSATKRRT